MSADTRITRAFKNAKRISFNKDSKFVLFSDCHRGTNSFADDFSHNSHIFHEALEYYYSENFTYIELGDGDELWKNKSLPEIFNAHKNIYMSLF